MDIHAITTQQLLETISRHCPSALGTYLHCLNRANHDGDVFLSKQMIQEDMSESWTAFRNNLKKLARENILEWHVLDSGVAITLLEILDD